MKNQQTIKMLFSIIKETLQEVGDYGIPSGQLFNTFSTYGLSIENYTAIISGLIDLKQIKKENDRLYWIA